jgi:photosystem II stability/assembly factor-like uncharacterized protein
MLAQYLRPTFGLVPVVALFAVFDALLAAAYIGQHSVPLAAAVVAAAAVSAWRFALAPSHRERLLWLSVLVVLLILLPELLAIATQGPNAVVHDGILLTDSAADRLLHGLNPYGHDYIDAPQVRRAFVIEAPVNWGLGHYVYPPGLILLDVPLKLLKSPSVNMTWLWPPALGLLCLSAYSLGRTDTERLACVAAVVLNPGFLIFFTQHYNDLLLLVPALAAVAFASRGRGISAGILLGLALCIKQSAVIFAPLTLLLVYRHAGRSAASRLLLAAGATAAVIMAPFLAWSPGAFIQDTASFFFSSGTDNDPIRGYGLTGILLHLGVIPNQWSPFPSGTIELAFLVPITIAAFAHLRRSFSWSAFWLWMAAQALAIFFFGRLMAPNYFQLFVTLLALGLLVRLPEGPQRRHTNTAARRAFLGGVIAVGLGVAFVVQSAAWLQPDASGYRVAMAASDGGNLYLADGVQGFIELDPEGHVRAHAPLPKLISPLSLSLDGDNGLMGTGTGLWLTHDRGGKWTRVVHLPPEALYGKYFSVAIRGPDWLAGAWGAGMWYSHDAGVTWHLAHVPDHDVEFEAIVFGESEQLAATELGILRSVDRGVTWVRTAGAPDRVTALSHDGSSYWAADWRGNVLQSNDSGAHWAQRYSLGGGVWSMAAGANLAGTTGGLYRGRSPILSSGLNRKEIVAVAVGGGRMYAARAKGAIYTLTADSGWRPIFHPTT